MNKIEFLRDLNMRLEGLELEEKREILEFYEERFYSGVFYENKTEEEVVNELETPGVIAKNVLHEYGVNPKYVKTNDIRYKGISGMQVLILVIFDLLIASWLIPTLYSVTFSLFASLITYFATFTLLIGDYGTSGPMLFAFSTSIYIFIFLFSLFILDISIIVTKAIFTWHLNVFKIKNRTTINKKLNKTSVEGWFKKHRKANLFRRGLFLLALVLILISGYQLTIGDNSFIEEYQNRVLEADVYDSPVVQDVIDENAWTIISNSDILDLDILIVESDSIKVTHKFYEEMDFEVTIDDVSKTVTIENVSKFNFFTFDLIDFFFNDDSGVTVEIPSDLLIEEINIGSVNGKVAVNGVTVNTLIVKTTNGDVSVKDSTILIDMDVTTTNGAINLRDLKGEIDLEASSTNGLIRINNAEFISVEVHTTNGFVDLDNLGLLDNGLALLVQTTNGAINIEDAYFNEISLITTNGNINFGNEDETFIPTVFFTETENGSINTYLD